MSDCKSCDDKDDEIAQLRAQIRRLQAPPIVADAALLRQIDAARVKVIAHGFLPDVIAECETHLPDSRRRLDWMQGLLLRQFVDARYRRLHSQADDIDNPDSVEQLLRPDGRDDQRPG